MRPFASWVRGRRSRRRPFNPYVAGVPVFDRRLFFGREHLARDVAMRIGSRSVKLTGERRIGKTSFLHYLRGILAEGSPEEPACFPVFVDLEAVTSAEPFLALMDEVVEATVPSARTRRELRVDAAGERYDGSDFGHDLELVVEELRQRTRRRVRLVLLIDEIDVVCGGTERAGAGWLEALLANCSPEFRVVLAGVRPGQPRIAYAGLDDIELGPLTPEQADELVRKPVAGVFRYERRAVERIMQLSQLRPYLIQGLCLHAVNRLLDEGRTTVELADVEAVARQDGQPLSSRDREPTVMSNCVVSLTSYHQIPNIDSRTVDRTEEA